MIAVAAAAAVSADDLGFECHLDGVTPITPCSAILALAALLFASAGVRADDHLVSRPAVEARLSDAAAERARNLATLDLALASPAARKAAAMAGLDLDQALASLPRLSDRELRDLSQRASALTTDPAAGYHYHDEVGAIVLIAVLGVIILVLLEAADHY